MTELYGGVIHAYNAREALIDTADAVLTYGAEVRPRGKLTRELRHFTVVIENPRDWSCGGIGAQWSGRCVAVEALQLIGGFSDPEWAIDKIPTLAPFLNPLTRRFDGAYGERTEHVLHYAVKRLQRDVDTRQAIVPIFLPEDAIREESLDFPCTLSLHFLIRQGQLDLDVTMRSNDVNWGLKHDIGQFCLLQLTVARLLGIEPGRYVHTSNSMHLYDTSFEWAEDLIFDGPTTVPQELLYDNGIKGDTVRDVQRRAVCIAYDTPLEDEGPTEAWLRERVR